MAYYALNLLILASNLDNGDSEKGLRFKHHRGKAKHQIHYHDNTDTLVSNIANNVANGLANETAEPTTNITSLIPTVPETGNSTELLPAPTASVTISNTSASVQPSTTKVTPVTSSSSSNASVGVSSQTVQPSPSPAPSTQQLATSSGGIASTNATGVVPAPTSTPSPSPSAGAPIVPIASIVSSVSGQITPMLGTSVAVTVVATQVVALPGQVKRKTFLMNMLLSYS